MDRQNSYQLYSNYQGDGKPNPSSTSSDAVSRLSDGFDGPVEEQLAPVSDGTWSVGYPSFMQHGGTSPSGRPYASSSMLPPEREAQHSFSLDATKFLPRAPHPFDEEDQIYALYPGNTPSDGTTYPTPHSQESTWYSRSQYRRGSSVTSQGHSRVNPYSRRRREAVPESLRADNGTSFQHYVGTSCALEKIQTPSSVVSLEESSDQQPYQNSYDFAHIQTPSSAAYRQESEVPEASVRILSKDLIPLNHALGCTGRQKNRKGKDISGHEQLELKYFEAARAIWKVINPAELDLPSDWDMMTLRNAHSTLEQAGSDPAKSQSMSDFVTRLKEQYRCHFSRCKTGKLTGKPDLPSRPTMWPSASKKMTEQYSTLDNHFRAIEEPVKQLAKEWNFKAFSQHED